MLLGRFRIVCFLDCVLGGFAVVLMLLMLAVWVVGWLRVYRLRWFACCFGFASGLCFCLSALALCCYMISAMVIALVYLIY